MKFIGQAHIMNQLRFILPDLYKNTERGANFLLRGPSGYGKTTMAISICKYLSVPEKNFEFYLGDWTEFRFAKRVIFIDEIHKMRDFEVLYPHLDDKSHVFVLATNKDGNLPEALVNRCFEFIFDDYSTDELLLIAMESSGFRASEEAFLQIIEAGNRNPRIIKSLVDRISTYFRENSTVDPSTTDFKELLEQVFRIKGGLDTLCRRYLEVLSDVGGNASISMLKSILHVDEDTLKNQVEPVLLRKALINITSKGRTLVYDN